MPSFNYDKATKVTVNDYEPAANDPRPIVDPKLEFEVDKSGMVHARNNPGQNQVLPGYGTSDFGVSSFETKQKISTGVLLISTGIAAAGIALFKFRDVLLNYALLLRESSKE